jgi:hypothetical protein
LLTIVYKCFGEWDFGYKLSRAKFLNSSLLASGMNVMSIKYADAPGADYSARLKDIARVIFEPQPIGKMHPDTAVMSGVASLEVMLGLGPELLEGVGIFDPVNTTVDPNAIKYFKWVQSYLLQTIRVTGERGISRFFDTSGALTDKGVRYARVMEFDVDTLPGVNLDGKQEFGEDLVMAAKTAYEMLVQEGPEPTRREPTKKKTKKKKR